MAETNLLISIRSCYDRLTRLEKKVADYVLQHPQEVVKMTINELSNSCGVGDRGKQGLPAIRWWRIPTV